MLTYAVRYSADEGTTWHTLTAGAVVNQLSVTLDMLPGGDNVLIKIEVSDGSHTASDCSDAPFSVGRKSPLSVGIVTPSDGERLVQSQLVTLAGAGYDLEDCILPGEALAWYSDRDGFLGRGDTVTTTLTAGAHVITLEAIDSDDLSASSTCATLH